ncbi:hypothetical protein [Streptomyces sp. IB201691-2A2]|uniref:hypothetical protein n=1 Tax=Streptomyces sp. IB201691-2A2 TaxID=2561920 RepID=UPI00117EAC9A|nr:hypothetical protein [Streptomyces sp. IB201691-2A2]TRO55833.1 hypothetical protein E4K73_49060 [Streptomyces sp. IB201691-2A2]
MFQETSIYSRLVAERGDIPQQVRGEAERVRRDLEQVMRSPSASGLSAQPIPAGPITSSSTR